MSLFHLILSKKARAEIIAIASSITFIAAFFIIASISRAYKATAALNFNNKNSGSAYRHVRTKSNYYLPPYISAKIDIKNGSTLALLTPFFSIPCTQARPKAPSARTINTVISGYFDWWMRKAAVLLISIGLVACGGGSQHDSAGLQQDSGGSQQDSGGSQQDSGGLEKDGGGLQQDGGAIVAASNSWGTSSKPFAATSPWNSRPVDPSLGDAVISTSKYAPAIEANEWSTGVFVSQASDRPVTISGHRGTQGLWNVDDHIFADVKISRWPSDVRPALESDGHADIVDPVEGIVHSFWQLRNEDNQWVAAQYAWTKLDGRGWGDPAHFFQGSRAAGVPAMAGLIRKHEVTDNMPLYRHALAMSLTTDALSPSPSYVFPATSADTEASDINSGAIPEGALMMLPASFDRSLISDARVRKIAETLMTYGAYVVDRNEGTPFIIYAEIGSGLELHEQSWNSSAIADLERIRLELRPVIGAKGWLDGNGHSYIPEKDFNLVSMRGPWIKEQGSVAGTFESWSQSVTFLPTSSRIVQKKNLPSTATQVEWAAPVLGESYHLTCLATGDAKLRLKVSDTESGKLLIDSGELSNGESYAFVWPKSEISVTMYVISGTTHSSSVRADLRQYVRQSDLAGTP